MTDTKFRRSGRISLAVAILIIGNDEEGTVFSEETHTVVLSLHGAGVVSKHKLVAEQELILRVVGTNREVEVRVVGEIAQQGEMHTYGVSFMDEGLDFWQMEFPVAGAWDACVAMLALECGACKDIVELANGEFEYDICAIHGGLARFCKECGLVTVWRQSHAVVPEGPRKEVGAREKSADVAVLEEPRKSEPEVVTLAEAMEGTERRGRVRAKVNFHACVKCVEFGQEIVACVDMSRGGVSFRSGNGYVRGMKIEIAVPYAVEAKEAPAIFVKGKIANVKELEGGGWRCGVEFVR